MEFVPWESKTYGSHGPSGGGEKDRGNYWKVLAGSVEGYNTNWKKSCDEFKCGLWPPDVKTWLTGKDPDAGEDWGQEDKGTAEDEMVGWHHRFDGRDFEQVLGVDDGQGDLVCFCSWGCKESDMTEQLNWTVKCMLPVWLVIANKEYSEINEKYSGISKDGKKQEEREQRTDGRNEKQIAR